MRRAKTEEHRHRATVAAFVLEKVGAVFGAHLRRRHVRAGATNEFTCIVAIVAAAADASRLQFTADLTTEIRLEHNQQQTPRKREHV